MIVLNANVERPKDGVFIGRPSILSNPFIINRDGDREEVILKFKSYFIEKFLFDLQYREDAIDSVMSKSKLIEDVKLVCFCKPNKCHGDVVKEVIEDYMTMDYNLFFIKYSKDFYKDSRDGLNYINVYARGTTQLGRYLSNLSGLALVHPEFGTFSSMEGYWYYISTGKIRPEFRSMDGYTAKQYGKTLDKVFNINFRSEIFEGLECKINQNHYLKELILVNDLPYVQYYMCVTGNEYKLSIPKDDLFINVLVEVIKKIKTP